MDRGTWWSTPGKLRVLVLACSFSLMDCFRALKSPPWSGDTTMEILMSWDMQLPTYPNSWIDSFAGHTNWPTVESCFHQVPILYWNHSRRLRFKRQIFNRNLYRKIFPFYRNYTVAWSLDINVAATLGIWSGSASHACLPRETALSGKRRWTRDGTWCHTRTPTMSPLSMVHISAGLNWNRTVGSQGRLDVK